MAIACTTPKVSICLPNLNNRSFLTERLDSILAQTFTNWELIIVDSYSDDGAWELFQDYAQREPRIKLFQAPRDGIYAGFNACIRRACSEYIYIATSDDTMTPDCLEKMVQALEQNQDCDLCQCALQLIDESSNPLPLDQQWETFAVSHYLRPWLASSHKRLAPHDGILHFAVLAVYTSVTQLLIRKRLFDAIGYFGEHWGAMADFEWEMRASLLYNTVYIPETLATWRVHSAQATTNPYTSQNLKILLKMSRHALNFAKRYDVDKVKHLQYTELAYHYQISKLLISLNECKKIAKLLLLLRYLFQEPKIVLDYLFKENLLYRFKGRSSPITWIKSKMTSLEIPEPVQLS